MLNKFLIILLYFMKLNFSLEDWILLLVPNSYPKYSYLSKQQKVSPNQRFFL